MPRYSPLPSVSIDPRNEAELVRAAAQTVYEASNQTLNDFSSGNPLAVLLEGMAFSQGELLYWANQLPDKILLEWIGPFLGAMRRLGTPSYCNLTIFVNPSSSPTIIPAGSSFSTNPQLTGGNSYEFVSASELIIPAGTFEGQIPVYSKFVGAEYNVPAKSISGFNGGETSAFSSCINLFPAVGGSDVETYQEVQERFFSLIRRRNPVSEADWQDFFTDLFGVGTLTSVQPNRSSRDSYRYNEDYVKPNGQVSFFVLGPNGTELTDLQLQVGQNAINLSTSVENKGHLFPISLSQAQYDLTVEVKSGSVFSSDYRSSSRDFRDRLFSILSPGNVFPANINPSVSGVESAFYSTFPQENRYIDPKIITSCAYNTPNGLSKNKATYTTVKKFNTSTELLQEGNLVRVDNPNPSYFPVLSSFTPYSTNKFDQTLYGNLQLKQIKNGTSGSYEVGDIVYFSGNLHVVLENVNINSSQEFINLQLGGKISAPKTYQPWTENSSYQYSVSNTINPDIVEFDYQDGDFLPIDPPQIPVNKRPGCLAWLVVRNFVLQKATNDVTGAQTEFKLGSAVQVKELISGETYYSGDWVSTPQIGSGPNQNTDPNYYYVDTYEGAVTKYAFVPADFIFDPGNLTVSAYFDSLCESGVLRYTDVYDGNNGLDIYRYKPRFKAGEYLEFKETSSSEPQYFIAAKYFTPPSHNILEMLEQGFVISLTPTQQSLEQFNQALASGFSGGLASLRIIEQRPEYTDGIYTSLPLTGGDGQSATVDVTVIDNLIASLRVKEPGNLYKSGEVLTLSGALLGGISDVVIRVLGVKEASTAAVRKPRRMFTFYKGDITFFRTRNSLKTYIVTQPVSPLFEFSVYLNNGVFVEIGAQTYQQHTEYIPFNNPEYSKLSEDTIESDGGKNLYRVMSAFTPVTEVTDWSGTTTVNTCRLEEYSGNLLRIVSKYSCDESILSQFGEETSSVKLGICRINILPQSSNVDDKSQSLSFIWENADSPLEVPQLSWYTGSLFQYQPPNYREGTLAL